MIKKDTYYGQSSGDLDPNLTISDFNTAEGIERNRVALAQHVNTYHQMSDKDLRVVCQEIQNLLGYFGIEPNEDDINLSNMNQLATMFKNNVPGPYTLTGVKQGSGVPTQNGASITFPQMTIVYNNSVYYSNTANNQPETTLAATTLTATSGWPNGAAYIYAKKTDNNTSVLDHQTTPIKGSEGATKCFLGSCFIINGQIQAGSWKYQPWLQISSVSERETPTARTKGGFISPNTGVTLQRGALQILDEGINFGNNQNQPNLMEIQAEKPLTYKVLYPGYDPSFDNRFSVETSKYYSLDKQAYVGFPDDITTSPTPKYMVMIPCIAPTGQDLMIPCMSHDNWDQIFDSQEEAANAVYGLQYADGLDSYASRAIYLGQALIIKIGATDLTDPANFMTVGVLPQELQGFVTASGQTGGATGAYIPMPEYDWTSLINAGSYNLTMLNNAANIIVGSSSNPITINPPSPQNGIINQFEIKYTHKSSTRGITWNSNLKWWGNAPTLTNGSVYNFIFEYVQGKWRGGYLTMPN